MTCMYISVQNSEDEVRAALDQLFRDATDILHILKAEQPPLDLWRIIAKEEDNKYMEYDFGSDDTDPPLLLSVAFRVLLHVAYHLQIPKKPGLKLNLSSWVKVYYHNDWGRYLSSKDYKRHYVYHYLR